MTTENKLSAVAAADSGAARKPRKKPFIASVIGAVFGFAGTVAPGATAKVVQKLLFTPARLKPSTSTPSKDGGTETTLPRGTSATPAGGKGGRD